MTVKKTRRSTTVSGIYRPERGRTFSLPLCSTRVPAGFPSPADDFIEKKMDLNEHLIKNPAATFVVKVSGDSMLGAGIHSGDLLIVDRSLEPLDKRVVVAALDGELAVKRIRKKGGRLCLVSENPSYGDIEVRELSELNIWGVVTFVIHKV